MLVYWRVHITVDVSFVSVSHSNLRWWLYWPCLLIHDMMCVLWYVCLFLFALILLLFIDFICDWDRCTYFMVKLFIYALHDYNYDYVYLIYIYIYIHWFTRTFVPFGELLMSLFVGRYLPFLPYGRYDCEIHEFNRWSFWGCSKVTLFNWNKNSLEHDSCIVWTCMEYIRSQM